ncbi:MAG: endonuclease domain-containing protein [Acidimicrobiia bacterium]
MAREPEDKVRFARHNRADPTVAERLLWQELRGSQLGVRFRREDPIGPYIADFSCRARRLDVETDGGTHIDPEKDRKRDRWFHAHGWSVLRFDDEDVTNHMEETIDLITQALNDYGSVVNPWNIPD